MLLTVGPRKWCTLHGASEKAFQLFINNTSCYSVVSNTTKTVRVSIPQNPVQSYKMLVANSGFKTQDITDITSGQGGFGDLPEDQTQCQGIYVKSCGFSTSLISKHGQV